MADADVVVRPACPEDHAWIDALVAEHFCSKRLVSGDRVYDAHALPGLVAERGGVRVGLLLYRMDGTECEVVAVIASPEGQGTGRCLLESARRLATDAGCRRLWLTTTNNNFGAILFYRAIGMTQVAVYYGAVDETRRLKPEIPLTDPDGVPIRDKIEFEFRTDNQRDG